MSLTTDSRQSVVERVQRDPDFAKTLLHAVSQWRARHRSADLCDLVNATVGFERLAAETAKLRQEYAQDALQEG